MSTSASQWKNRVGRTQARQLAKKALQLHLPVGHWTGPLCSLLYKLHVLTRSSVGWCLRFFWYEPLLRSQCASVGDRFRMEQLPYIVGRGFVSIGNDVQFSGKPSFAFTRRHSSTPSLSIGDRTFLGHNCAITIAKRVTIGKDCLIAGGVRIADHDGHPLEADKRRAGQPPSADSIAPVTVGDDVWIGHGAIILKGVRLGDRSVVGAHAVVTRDVPPDTVVAGNPARVVKNLASENLASENSAAENSAAGDPVAESRPATDKSSLAEAG